MSATAIELRYYDSNHEFSKKGARAFKHEFSERLKMGQDEKIVSQANNPFALDLRSNREIVAFNDSRVMSVNYDKYKSPETIINMRGAILDGMCLCETHSPNGFFSVLQDKIDFFTVWFVVSGSMSCQVGAHDIASSQAVGILTRSIDLPKISVEGPVKILSATIPSNLLLNHYSALMGQNQFVLPNFKSIADMSLLGIRSLMATIRLAQHRIQDHAPHADIHLPLIQEIISYQLLSIWPKLSQVPVIHSGGGPASKIRVAMDYIEERLSCELLLSEVAAAAGISVRSLQVLFKKHVNRTPVQFIIERRLDRTHADLVCNSTTALSIADIARKNGFTHMSDFSQRFRRRYGYKPSDARTQAVSMQSSAKIE